MKSFWKTSITSALFASTLLTGVTVGNAANVSDMSSSQEVQSSHFAGSIDLSVINDEKLIEALQKRGVISKDASEKERQAGLKKYLAKKGSGNLKEENDPLAQKVKKSEKMKEKKFKEYNDSLLNGKGNKTGFPTSTPAPVSESSSPGVVSKGKLLTLTVEYSDVKHNQISPSDTDNYYDDYTLQHYEDMIFGDEGVKGPNGEKFVSQKQFYEEQSGGTYTIEGKAYGWLTVPGTAAYYGADNASGHDNVSPGGARKLIRDTYIAARQAGIPLEDYDLEDPHDFDGDGNLWESDGFVDHLQIIHAGMGQEAGGGAQGDDAIWSHRSAVAVDEDGYFVGKTGFYDYTIMPEDGATGVFAHEYGHDLGYPDEYDTIYSGTGEAVGYWSIMASGSWAGKIPGTEPSGFSPLAKQYLQATLGGQWFEPSVLQFDELTSSGTSVLLDQANSPLGSNNQAVRLNMPQKKTFMLSPKTGAYQFWGGQGDEIDNRIITSVDLAGKASATLSFDAWYSIEENWDYAFVQVSTDGGNTWTSLGNDHTNSDAVAEAYPTILDSMPGFTGESNGWQPQSFDLSSYAGQEILLSLRYATDWGSSLTGFFADNVKVIADGQTIVEDGAEVENGPFELNGFIQNDGNKYSDHYYLMEWRNHQGVDNGLAHITRGSSNMSYDSGLVVWYVDPTYTDNWTGIHPGNGFLSIVDAQPSNLMWNLKKAGSVQASTRYHLADAAFGIDSTSGLNLNYPGLQSLKYAAHKGIRLFDDSAKFSNQFMPDAGVNVTSYGLKVRVNGQAADKSVGSIVLYK